MELVKSLGQNEEIIQKCKSNIRRCFLLIGEAFFNIREGNLWQKSGCNSFSEYIEQTHGIKKSTGYSLITVFEAFGKEIENNVEYQNINYTRLIELAPLVTENTKEELLHAAANIPSSRAWEDQIRELRGKPTTDSEHTHDFQEIGIMQCKICGLKVKKTISQIPYPQEEGEYPNN